MADAALLERGRELDALHALAVDAARGRGRLAIVEGTAGIGKTSLLRSAATRAPALGLNTCCWASGGQHERELAFGVARQLLGSRIDDELMRGAAGLAAPVFDPRSSRGAGDEAAILHGLHWVVAGLAERGPVMLVVDDLQWADAPSQGWLLYLARRIEDLPVLLALGLRTGEPESDAPPVATLRAMAGAAMIRPQPLSLDASVGLVRESLGGDAEPDFYLACHRATGGNPLLLTELSRALRLEGIEPTAQAASRVVEIGAATVGERVLQRIRTLAPEASGFAQAVAVLQPHAALGRAAAVAELSTEQAAQVAAALVEAEVLVDSSPLAFVHPLVHAAVEQDLSEPERRRLHARAAEVHHEVGDDSDVVASHLLRTDLAAGDWVVPTLIGAADAAIARGAPALATRHLARALEEPGDDEQRLDLSRRLGSAQLRAGDAAGIERLLDVRDRSSDPNLRLQVSSELANAYVARGRFDDMRQLLAEAIADAERVGDSEMILMARTRIADLPLFVGRSAEEAELPELRQALRAANPGSQAALIAHQSLAMWNLVGVATESELRANARAAVEDEAAVASSRSRGYPLFGAFAALACAGETGRALEGIDQGVAATRARGSRYGTAVGLGFRAAVLAARGDLAEAESDAAEAAELTAGTSYAVTAANARAALAFILTERNRLDDADRTLAETSFEDLAPPGVLTPWGARALLRLRQGRAAEGVADARLAAEALGGLGAVMPDGMSSRFLLPLALHAAGEVEEARERARAALDHARARGHRRETAEGLRVAGLVDPDAGIAALREAVATSDGTDFRLDHARCLCDLGAALRRANERRACREPLQRALDLAHRLGAHALAERTLDELRATGARPRRLVLSGVESLTASELRVARLAAEGLSNPEIAQALFVTRGTVESHLRHCYAKLEITGRGELAAALGASR